MAASHYIALPKSSHNQPPTIPRTPLLPRPAIHQAPKAQPTIQSSQSQPTIQSSQSQPTSTNLVPKPNSFPNHCRTSTNPPQILYQCFPSGPKPTVPQSLSFTQSPVTSSPSKERSPLKHTNHTTPPTLNKKYLQM